MWRWAAARGRRQACVSQRRLFAATAEHPAYAQSVARFQDLKKKYPGLFDSAKLQKEQKGLIDAHFKPAELKKWTEKWNAKVKELQDMGVRFHYGIGMDTVMEGWISNQPDFPKELPRMEPLASPEHDWKLIQRKFAAGAKVVDKLEYLKEFLDKPWEQSDGQKNLALIEADDLAYDLDKWMLYLEEEDNEFKAVRPPVSMEEQQEWLENDMATAPMVGCDEWGSSRSVFIDWEKMDQKQVEPLKKYMAERHDRFFKEVVCRDGPVDRKKWDDFQQVQIDLFNPRDITHYEWLEEAKDVFRGTLWRGQEAVEAMDKELERLVAFMEASSDYEIDIKRRCYEDRPDLPFRAEVAMELQARDPLAAAKILARIGAQLDQSTFDKGIRDLLSGYMKIFFQSDREGNQRELEKYESIEADEKKRHQMELGDMLPDTHKSTTADYFRRRGEMFKQREAMFDAEPVSLEQLVDEIVPKSCWALPNDPRMKDIEAFKKMTIDACMGKVSLKAYTEAYFKLMPNNQDPKWFKTEEKLKHDDPTNLVYFCEYYATRERYPELWEINNILAADQWFMTTEAFSEKGKQLQKTLSRAILEKAGFSPSILNMVHALIDNERTHIIPDIRKMYSEMLKRYKGELHGVLKSAEELSDAEFDSIMAALNKANPGKKFFLNRVVEPALMAGFQVKVGVQTLDFSLLREVEDFKKAQATA